MKTIRSISRFASSLLFTLTLAVGAVARADYIDIQDRPSGNHHHHPVESLTLNGARYTYSESSAGRVETFEELDSTCGRIEHVTDVSYKTGRHIFTGDVKIIDVSGTIIFQIFNALASGPIMFIQASSSLGGNLHKYGNGPVIATDVLNVWTNLRIDHDLDADTLSIYVNGSLKWSGSGGKGNFSGGMKYGTYGGDARPVKVQWRNAQWWDDTSFKIVNRKSGKVISVNGSSTDQGAQTVQWSYTADSNRCDEWKIIDVQKGYRQFQNVKSGLALNVNAASTSNGASVIQWPYSGATPTNDDWQIIDTDSGFVRIMNRNSDKSLNVSGASTTNGASLVQWSYTADTTYNDEWQLVPLP